jgi:hypothetical protein
MTSDSTLPPLPQNRSFWGRVALHLVFVWSLAHDCIVLLPYVNPEFQHRGCGCPVLDGFQGRGSWGKNRYAAADEFTCAPMRSVGPGHENYLKSPALPNTKGRVPVTSKSFKAGATRLNADHQYVDGQLRRSKKRVSLRGLNRNHNHELKNLFKSAATIAASKAGSFQQFYDALVAKGMRPEMARLTLARKIAAITLLVWKKGVCFDAQHLKPQTAGVFSGVRSIPWGSFLAVASRVLETLGFEGESALIS